MIYILYIYPTGTFGTATTHYFHSETLRDKRAMDALRQGNTVQVSSAPIEE